MGFLVQLKLYVDDDSVELMTGLVAEIFENWLEIEYLFVKEELRGQGICSQLLQQVESEAKKRNCCYVFVNTRQCQAPAFYQKHGYKKVFAFKDYPYTGQRHYYQKICKHRTLYHFSGRVFLLKKSHIMQYIYCIM